MEGKCVFLYKRTRETVDLIWTKLTEPADGFDDFPAWSPDGTRIAFNSTRDGNSNIYVIPAEGGDPRRLTDWPSFEGFPAWSPDGKTLAFCSNRDGDGDIFALELDTGQIDRIISQEGLQMGPSWANDAGEIFFFLDRYAADRGRGRQIQNKSRNPDNHHDFLE